MEAEHSINAVPTPEVEPLKLDAIFVHGYWESKSDQPYNVDGYRGSLRNRLATRAACDLHDNLDGVKLVFIGGELLGPSRPSTARVFEEEAVGKYKVPPENIITGETGFNTQAEAIGFQRVARENGWKNCAVLYFSDHSPSVKRFTPPDSEKTGFTTTYLTVESVLEKYDDPHIAYLAKKLSKGRYHIGFKAYEAAKTIINLIPGGTKRMYKAGVKSRTKKDNSLINDLITAQIDVFNSNTWHPIKTLRRRFKEFIRPPRTAS